MLYYEFEKKNIRNIGSWWDFDRSTYFEMLRLQPRCILCNLMTSNNVCCRVGVLTGVGCRVFPAFTGAASCAIDTWSTLNIMRCRFFIDKPVYINIFCLISSWFLMEDLSFFVFMCTFCFDKQKICWKEKIKRTKIHLIAAVQYYCEIL